LHLHRSILGWQACRGEGFLPGAPPATGNFAEYALPATLHCDDPAGSSLELDALGDFVSCPGEPVDSATLNLIGR
jgi:hypothetical protein